MQLRPTMGQHWQTLNIDAEQYEHQHGYFLDELFYEKAMNEERTIRLVRIHPLPRVKIPQGPCIALPSDQPVRLPMELFLAIGKSVIYLDDLICLACASCSLWNLLRGELDRSSSILGRGSHHLRRVLHANG